MTAITGANGFVGRACVARFAAGGWRVRALTRSGGTVEGADEQATAPDLGPEADWSLALRDAQIVVHCAARVHIMEDTAADPVAEFRRVNCEGTLALGRAAVAAGVKRFVFISSIKVNGETTDTRPAFREEDAPLPADPYGQSKLEAEQGLLELAASTTMTVTIVRPVLVYGPGVKANFAALMKAVAMGIPLPLASTRGLRSLVYVENLADLIFTAAVRKEGAGQVFLAADGEDLTTGELARRIGQALGRPARLFPFPHALAGLMGRLTGKDAAMQRLFGSLAVDTSKAHRLLGWSPSFTVDEALAKTVRGL